MPPSKKPSLQDIFSKDLASEPAETAAPSQNSFSPQTLAAHVGHGWDLPDKNSPLSPIDRGVVGWLSKYSPPQAQTYLERRFGKTLDGQPTVKIAKMDEGGANFLIRDQNGYHEADPSGLSDIPLAIAQKNWGKAFNAIRHPNLPNIVGEGVQFIGEHGPEMVGAEVGGALGQRGGTAIGDATGPLAPIAAPVLGYAGKIVGGAMGSAAAGIADLGVRKGLQYLQDATKTPILGAHDVSLDELKHQTMSSMVFGATQEAIGPVMNYLMKGTAQAGAKAFGAALEGLSDSPTARSSLATMLKLFGGSKESLARAWANAPADVADKAVVALDDIKYDRNVVRDKQAQHVYDFEKRAKAYYSGPIAKEYEAINEAASGKNFDALGLGPQQDSTIVGKSQLPQGEVSPITKTIHGLQSAGYFDQELNVGNQAVNSTADVSGNNGLALKQLANDYKALASNGGVVTYETLREIEQNIENRLWGDGKVADGALRKSLLAIRTEINNVQAKGLNEINPAIAERQLKVNTLLGGSGKEEGTGLLSLMDALNDNKSSPEKIDAFLKQIHAGGGSGPNSTYNSQLLDNISSLTGLKAPTQEILRWQAAKESTAWFGGRGTGLFSKIPSALPAATRNMAAKGAEAFSDFKDLVEKQATPEVIDKQEALASGSVTAALTKAHQVYQALPQDQRASFIKNPEAVSTLHGLMTEAPAAEQAQKSKLLQEAGAFQNSQFQGP